jgi:hypothetical protein
MYYYKIFKVVYEKIVYKETLFRKTYELTQVYLFG